MSNVTKDLLDALKGLMALPDHRADLRDAAKAARAAIARAEAALSARSPQPDSSVWVLASAFSPWRSPVACDARHHPRRGSQ